MKKEEIIILLRRLREKFGDKTFEGNCAMVAIALGKFLSTKGLNQEIGITVFTDLSPEEFEREEAEPDIYHVAVRWNAKKDFCFDTKFLFSSMINIADYFGGKYFITYQADTPIYNKIRQETNWQTEWQVYYNWMKNYTV